jgi:hypothetical protein
LVDNVSAALADVVGQAAERGKEEVEEGWGEVEARETDYLTIVGLPGVFFL